MQTHQKANHICAQNNAAYDCKKDSNEQIIQILYLNRRVLWFAIEITIQKKLPCDPVLPYGIQTGTPEPLY